MLPAYFMYGCPSQHSPILWNPEHHAQCQSLHTPSHRSSTPAPAYHAGGLLNLHTPAPPTLLANHAYSTIQHFLCCERCTTAPAIQNFPKPDNAPPLLPMNWFCPWFPKPKGQPWVTGLGFLNLLLKLVQSHWRIIQEVWAKKQWVAK